MDTPQPPIARAPSELSIRRVSPTPPIPNPPFVETIPSVSQKRADLNLQAYLGIIGNRYISVRELRKQRELLHEADNEIEKGEWAVGSFRGSAWMKNRERVAWRRRQARSRRKKSAGKDCKLPGGGHRPRLIDYRNERSEGTRLNSSHLRRSRMPSSA